MPEARRLVLCGLVQGVGFRPFVFRLAQRFALRGWVRNGAGRVFIRVEGDALAAFEHALIAEAPPTARARIESREDVAVAGFKDFRILASEAEAEAEIHLPPDLFCCEDCLAELRDPGARRFGYAFTNCTQCGPRYTIIAALPYDRSHTSMAGFALCPRCRAEYENPGDRRFHAEPLACPDCGPKLTFRGLNGEAALQGVVARLQAGGIVAVKGIGGYHLLCDAADDAAVQLLRGRKHRPDKPLAVMFPWEGADGLEAVRRCCVPDEREARALCDPARPIVLLRRREDCGLSPAIAPGLKEIGAFLPYSPLHHLLLAAFGGPLVATSGNVSGEPVITDHEEAERRLGEVADGFLHHDRPIMRPADDSVVRAMAGAVRPLRIGRGLAPLEIEVAGEFSQPVLAVGGHMKAAVALGWGKRVVVSPHIGELDSPRSMAVFEQVIADLQALYRVEARRIVCDAHPAYASGRWARAQGLPVRSVQHHRAHASALAGEHPEISSWLVFAWDGIGYGEGELWGGEAFKGAPGRWQRVASMRPFHLLGEAGREPWRSAAALLWETGGEYAAPDGLAWEAWKKRVGTYRCSSIGRLFDAAAALVLGLECVSYEGQGPMLLEAAAMDADECEALPLRQDGGILRADWEKLPAMLRDATISPAVRAGLFHEILAQTLAAQAEALQPFEAVGLTGGVFQNRRLAERAMALLAARSMAAYLPERLPANDGGLAFGQLIEEAAWNGM